MFASQPHVLDVTSQIMTLGSLYKCQSFVDVHPHLALPLLRLPVLSHLPGLLALPIPTVLQALSALPNLPFLLPLVATVELLLQKRITIMLVAFLLLVNFRRGYRE
jgi:hypothetical protein